MWTLTRALHTFRLSEYITDPNKWLRKRKYWMYLQVSYMFDVFVKIISLWVFFFNLITSNHLTCLLWKRGESNFFLDTFKGKRPGLSTVLSLLVFSTDDKFLKYIRNSILTNVTGVSSFSKIIISIFPNTWKSDLKVLTLFLLSGYSIMCSLKISVSPACSEVCYHLVIFSVLTMTLK